MVKVFEVAAKAADEQEEEPLEFQLGSKSPVLRAYKPTDGQMALLMSAMGRHTNIQTKVGGAVDFLVSVLDDNSHAYVVDRLLDRDDPLPVEQIEEVLEWLVEEWTGRPTERPSGSTSSRRTSGSRSTARPRASTS